jgi:hypothetical protein
MGCVLYWVALVGRTNEMHSMDLNEPGRYDVRSAVPYSP